MRRSPTGSAAFRALAAASLTALAACAARAPAEAPPEAPPEALGGALPTAREAARAASLSIVAWDGRELGVATLSQRLAVGAHGPRAEAGVGAVAVQSFADAAMAERALERLRAGAAAPDALRELVATDRGAALRQLALVDARGRVAAHTGERCVAHAGQATGEGVAALAVRARVEEVVPALERAFRESAGAPLAERLLRALEAGQEAGGELGGSRSAALRVVPASAEMGAAETGARAACDLRVDDHPAPLAELRRLLRAHAAWDALADGDAALERGAPQEALEAYARAARLAPDLPAVRFWSATTLAVNGRLEPAAAILRGVLEDDPEWAELLRRLPAARLLDEATVRTLLERARER